MTNKLITYIFLLSFFNINAQIVKQFYIQITPNEALVNCGKLKVKKNKTKLESFIGKEASNNIKPEAALNIIKDSLILKNPEVSKVVFFIHGFWASLPFAISRTSKSFEENYFKTDSIDKIAFVHIIWDANDVLYKHTLQNLNNSTKTLSEILNNVKLNFTIENSLMCHSMGNRFLFQTLFKEDIKVHFENLLLVAPDLDYRKFEQHSKLFTSIAKTVDVFYNEKDNTLNMSKGINKIERLGRINKSNIAKEINFIDCTAIDDISTFSDSVMKHLYFITSKTVIGQIEKIIIN